MAEACNPDSSGARKSQTLILQRLATVGQKPAGEAIGKSETWVSRWKSDDLETCVHLLSALGLKVVPAENVCYVPEHIAHLQYFAKLGMQNAPEPIQWGDE